MSGPTDRRRRDSTARGEPPTAHLSVEDVAAYVDGRTDGEDRRRIEEHLSLCLGCGDDVVAAAEAHGPSTPRRARRRGLAGLAAAAAALLLVRGVWVVDGDGNDPRAFRDRSDSAAVVRILEPADRAAIDRRAARFVWRPIAPDASYSFAIQDEVGTLLWSGTTSDTVLTLENRVLLEPGATYYWSVDALLRDGQTASSGTHELTASRE